MQDGWRYRGHGSQRGDFHVPSGQLVGVGRQAYAVDGCSSQKTNDIQLHDQEGGNEHK